MSSLSRPYSSTEVLDLGITYSAGLARRGSKGFFDLQAGKTGNGLTPPSSSPLYVLLAVYILGELAAVTLFRMTKAGCKSAAEPLLLVIGSTKGRVRSSMALATRGEPRLLRGGERDSPSPSDAFLA